MEHTAAKYEHLFDIPADGIPQQLWPSVRSSDVLRYRSVTTKAGPGLEINLFPVWKTAAETKKAAAHETKAAQKKLNERNAIRELALRIEANFSEGSCHVVLTFRDKCGSFEAARGMVKNFVRRLRTRADEELRYIYVISNKNQDGDEVRRHIHMIIPRLCSMAKLQELWGYGAVKREALEPLSDGSYMGLATYLYRQAEGRPHRWTGSRNLIRPERATKDNRRLGKTAARRMAQDFEDAPREILEGLFPGYRFCWARVQRSDHVAGLYITARLVRHERR